MISEKVLNELLPLPKKDEEIERIKQKLIEDNFPITNFKNGGIFYTILNICIQIRFELITLLRSVLSNMFITHAQDLWLEVKAADFSKTRKQAVKTKGMITLSRNVLGDGIRIKKGQVFKSGIDINGETLSYIVTKDVVMTDKMLMVKVEAEAEQAGAKYNVPEKIITNSLTHIEGIDTITNDSDWILQEGADIEPLESLRVRTLRSWAELSTNPIADKYKNICEAIEGVLFVQVEDLHPRGQGTIDIIVTGTNGEATEQLLLKVKAAANSIKGSYDDILVKTSILTPTNISVNYVIDNATIYTGIENDIKDALIKMLSITKDRDLNALNIADIIYCIKSNIQQVKNVKVIAPAEDVLVTKDKIISAGTITINVVRG